MEQRYLIDTNIVIYYLADEIPDTEIAKVDAIFSNSFNISTITKIEVLGWKKIDEETKNRIENFITNANIFYVDETIENVTIRIKQKQKIDTPDAIIAATALINNLILVTRNIDDFKSIDGLTIYNPFD